MKNKIQSKNKEKDSGKFNNNSIAIDLRTKVRSGYDTAKDALAMRDIAFGPEFLNVVCEELLEWGKLDTSTDMLDFYHSYGMPSTTFHAYRNKYADLDHIHSMVKEMVGTRRQKLAVHKLFECDPSTIAKTLRLFHPDWRNAYQEEADLRKEMKAADDKTGPTHITVEMPRYETTDRNKD
jgi:hypothetical protein